MNPPLWCRRNDLGHVEIINSSRSKCSAQLRGAMTGLAHAGSSFQPTLPLRIVFYRFPQKTGKAQENADMGTIEEGFRSKPFSMRKDKESLFDPAGQSNHNAVNSS